MVAITIPKKEYQKLVETRIRYERLRDIMKEDVFSSPPLKKRGDVLRAFKKSGLYTDTFLKSLKRGLERSSYFRA